MDKILQVNIDLAENRLKRKELRVVLNIAVEMIVETADHHQVLDQTMESPKLKNVVEIVTMKLVHQADPKSFHVKMTRRREIARSVKSSLINHKHDLLSLKRRLKLAQGKNHFNSLLTSFALEQENSKSSFTGLILSLRLKLQEFAELLSAA